MWSFLQRLLAWLRSLFKRKQTYGKFGPFTDAKGNPVAATQLQLNQPYTSKLVFLDAAGNPVAGPVGTVAASDPSAAAISLSSDGQSVNLTMKKEAAVTLTWHDPSGAVPDFTADVAVPFGPAVSGAFGPFVPGTAP